MSKPKEVQKEIHFNGQKVKTTELFKLTILFTSTDIFKKLHFIKNKQKKKQTEGVPVLEFTQDFWLERNFRILRIGFVLTQNEIKFSRFLANQKFWKNLFLKCQYMVFPNPTMFPGQQLLTDY